MYRDRLLRCFTWLALLWMLLCIAYSRSRYRQYNSWQLLYTVLYSHISYYLTVKTENIALLTLYACLSIKSTRFSYLLFSIFGGLTRGERSGPKQTGPTETGERRGYFTLLGLNTKLTEKQLFTIFQFLKLFIAKTSILFEVEGYT